MSDNRAIKLLEAFSGVEEDLLERCESAVVGAEEELRGENTIETVTAGSQRKIISLADRLKKNFKKNSWRYGSAAAAVVCLVVVGAAYFGGLRLTTNDSAAFEAVMDEMSGGAGAAVNTATVENGATQQDGTSAVAMYQATAESVKTDSKSGETAGSTDDIVESATGTSSGQMNVGNATEKVREEANVNGAVDNSEEKSTAEETKDMEAPKPEFAITENDTDVGCKEFAYVTVTEADARAHERFGAYVPVKLPGGYVFEGAYVSDEGESPALMVSWSRGLDSIMINMTLLKEAPATVDVSKTETYDEYLYEIPHAETVPEEYREVFNNPVCAYEDFSLEFVQKRMIVRDDAGDTDTPRGNFSVLYPDGVLVYFNGRGTAEEIWELFDSMNVAK